MANDLPKINRHRNLRFGGGQYYCDGKFYVLSVLSL